MAHKEKLMDKSSVTREAHHAAPRCLISLHEKANGTSLDGEGIQAWLEWEWEAMRWRVPVEISRDELEAARVSQGGAPRGEALRLAARTVPQNRLGSSSRRGDDDDGAAPPRTD